MAFGVWTSYRRRTYSCFTRPGGRDVPVKIYQEIDSVTVSNRFHLCTQKVSLVASSRAFIIELLVVSIRAIARSIFKFSDTCQLVINTRPLLLLS